MNGMTWDKLLNPQRLGKQAAKQESGRSSFLSDYDKIIFSKAFRRLARKTQVHPLSSHDMVHNRMTHSLEVASVGRTLAVSIAEQLMNKGRLPTSIHPADLGDIVQSACLAHDIGNPAFGHAGERAIQSWFRTLGQVYLKPLSFKQKQDFIAFNGNAQGFRILTAGLQEQGTANKQLTYATLATFIKYPWPAYLSHDLDHKSSVFNAEISIFKEITAACGMQSLAGSDAYCRHPLSYIVEAADDFCYALLDLEDGLMMGLIHWQEFYAVIKPLFSSSENQQLMLDLEKISDKNRAFLVRGKAFDAYITAAAKVFIDHEEEFLAGKAGNNLIALCPSYVFQTINNAKALAQHKIFSAQDKVETEQKIFNVTSLIMQQLMQALMYYEQQDKAALTALPQCERALLDDIISDLPLSFRSDRYQLILALIDFVSGMTDNYAMTIYEELSSMTCVA